MNIDKWTAVQRQSARLSTLYRADRMRITGKSSPDDWLVVGERETVVAVVSPETYWETDDPVAAKTRAHLLAAAPEMLELLRDVRQYVADANLRSDGYAEIDLKAIDALLAKVEGECC